MQDPSDMTRAAAASVEPRADTSAPSRAPVHHRNNSPWGDTRVLDTAIRLYRDGRSAAEVAAALLDHHRVRVTRNAVIGLMHRLGVKGGGERHPARPDAPARPRGKTAHRKGPPRAGRARLRPSPPAWRREAAVAAPGKGVPFLEASDAQCPFPLWDETTPRSDRRVCGAPRCEPAAPLNCYCAFHARLCFVPRGEHTR
jgi:hypothetical protein